jgi:hypothetical protein
MLVSIFLMRLNLDSLRGEIEEHLRSRGMVVFQSFPSFGDPEPMVFWNTARHPEYTEFVAAAEAAGARMMTMFSREMEEDLIEGALGRLDDAVMENDERRSIASRLKTMRGYTGFTCEIQLSFDSPSRTYVFDLRTDWFNDLNDLIDRIEECCEEEDDDEEEPDDLAGGGYFQRN